MSIDLTEATRLARICLPQILADSETAGEAVDDATATTPLLTDEHVSVKTLCRLWAGMGYIYQVTIAIPSSSSSSSLSLALNNNKHIKSNNIAYHHFIIKQIVIPPPTPHSRRSVGNERKAYSYFIEAKFYQSLAPILIKNHNLAIPIPYHIELGGCSDDAEKGYGNLSDNSRVTVEEKDQIISICMSLLNGSPSSNRDGTNNNIHAALSWLATLHAATWGAAKVDAYVGQKLVHPIGSYWHLDTRPDEHESMPNQGWEGRLKRAARAINERLRRDTMQCCIHGDAKDANMLFQKMDDDDDGGGSGVSVSMFDFQYCGKAPPSVDLAYYLCVAAGGIDSEYIQYYHQHLSRKLNTNGILHPPTLQELEESTSLAVCDFQRFMSGWGQWGSDVSDLVIEVLDRLDGGSILSEDDYREAVMREYG